MALSLNVQLLRGVKEDGELANIKDQIDYSVANNTTSNLATLSVKELSSIYVDLWEKFGAQICLDIMGGWSNPLSKLMLRSSNSFGEFTEVDSVNSNPEKDAENYSKITNPFTYYAKPEVNSDIYGITDEKRWFVSTNPAQLRKAMLSTGGIFDLLSSLIVGTIENKANIYMFVRSKQMLTTLPYALAIEPIKINDDTKRPSEIAYTRILNAITKFTQPSTKFNEAGFYTTTQKGYCDLVLNTESKATFDVNVVASLFHSDKIGLEVGETVTCDLSDSEEPTCIGYLFDKDKFRMEQYLKETTALFNPDMTTTYWLNLWLKCGIVKSLNGVKIMTSIFKPTYVFDKTALTLTLDCATRNATIYYKKTADTDYTKYTKPITYVANTSYDFIAKVPNSTIPNSEVVTITSPVA